MDPYLRSRIWRSPETGTNRGKTVTTHYVDYRTIQVEIEARYPQRRRVRRDSSLEIMRRTLARVSREENQPGRTR